jgi:hypothetical protein
MTAAAAIIALPVTDPAPWGPLESSSFAGTCGAVRNACSTSRYRLPKVALGSM